MSKPGRRRIDEIGDESRRRILDAAETLFAERGFEHTSFADIAERSGISRGSIPWHFKNKHGLFISVINRAMDRTLAPESYNSPPTLTEVVQDYAAWVRTADTTLVFMALNEAIASSGAINEQYREFFAEHRRRLELWLRAQRPGTADPDSASKRERAFVVAFTGTLFGIHLQSLVDRDNIDFDEALHLVAAQFEKDLPDVWDTPEARVEDHGTI